MRPRFLSRPTVVTGVRDSDFSLWFLVASFCRRIQGSQLLFLGVRLLTQSIAPTTKEIPMSKAVIGAACVSHAVVTKEIQCRHTVSIDH